MVEFVLGHSRYSVRFESVLKRFWLKVYLRYGLRPLTSWRFAHTRPKGNQRLFPLGSPSRPATFSLSAKQERRKGRHGVDPAFNFILSPPRTYSKMLTLPMVHPVPRKLA